MSTSVTRDQLLTTWVADWQGEKRAHVIAALTTERIESPFEATEDVDCSQRRDIRPLVARLEGFLDRLGDVPDALPCILQSAPKSRAALFVFAKRCMLDDDVELAISLLRRCLSLYFDDLVAQSLLIEAYQKLPRSKQPPEFQAAARSLSGRFCAKPFSHFETTPKGDVYVCCPSYLPVPIGNINSASWNEIWNSSTAQEIRRSILDQDFKHCSRLICPLIQANTLREISFPSEDVEITKDVKERRVKLNHGPSFVNLSHDPSCNLSCPSCRTNIIVAKQSEQAQLDVVRDNVILPILNQAKRVWITGSGDPFGSKHFRDVLDHLNPNDHPHLTVDLQTNGQLFARKEWERLQGLHSMIGQVYISIDAALEETYSNVRRGGTYKRLTENMAFISELRRDNKIRRLVVAFVVQACNFREMEDFVRNAVSWNADSVSFSRIRQWGTYSAEEFKNRDVFAPEHPDYTALKEILGKPVFRDPIVWMGNVSLD